MLQVREKRFHCANGLVVLREHWLHCCRKCALLAAMLFFHSCFFTHSINQGWANLFNGRVICRKSKTPASRKTSLLCQYKYGKECKFYIKWCTYSNCQYEVFVWFSSPRKPGQYVVKTVQINSPKCSFFRVARWFDFTNFITEKTIHSIMLCFTQKWVIH